MSETPHTPAPPNNESATKRGAGAPPAPTKSAAPPGAPSSSSSASAIAGGVSSAQHKLVEKGTGGSALREFQQFTDSFRQLFRQQPKPKRLGPLWHMHQLFVALLPSAIIMTVAHFVGKTPEVQEMRAKQRAQKGQPKAEENNEKRIGLAPAREN